MEYSELTPEQKAKAEACKTPAELIALAKEEGVELSDEQLEAVSGGAWGAVNCHALNWLIKEQVTCLDYEGLHTEGDEE